MNIHHASIVYYGAQLFLGRQSSRRLYRAFIDVFRTKTRESAARFYGVVNRHRRTCKDDDFAGELFILERSAEDIRDTLSVVDKYTLDPAMHALIDLAGHWNDDFDEGFVIVHDRSNTIRNQKHTLDYLVNLKVDPTRVGYGDFKVTYPLRIKDFKFKDSQSCYSIKLCDLACGMLLAGFNHSSLDDFSSQVRTAIKPWKLSNLIWPSLDMEPMKNKKREPTDIDPFEFLTSQIQKDPPKK